MMRRAETTYRTQFYQAIEQALAETHRIGTIPDPASPGARCRWLNAMVSGTGLTRVDVLRAGMSEESLRLPASFTKEACADFAKRARVHHAEWQAASSVCTGDLVCRDIDSYDAASTTANHFYDIA